LKVQQFTGSHDGEVAGDTTFYRYHRLLALNEVGGDPLQERFPADEFHATMRSAPANGRTA